MAKPKRRKSKAKLQHFYLQVVLLDGTIRTTKHFCSDVQIMSLYKRAIALTENLDVVFVLAGNTKDVTMAQPHEILERGERHPFTECGVPSIPFTLKTA